MTAAPIVWSDGWAISHTIPATPPRWTTLSPAMVDQHSGRGSRRGDDPAALARGGAGRVVGDVVATANSLRALCRALEPAMGD